MLDLQPISIGSLPFSASNLCLAPADFALVVLALLDHASFLADCPAGLAATANKVGAAVVAVYGTGLAVTC